MNNNTLINTARSMKRVAMAGAMLAVGAASLSAAILAETANYDDLTLTAPALKVNTPSQQVNGTGTMRYTFKFDIDGGCCMRVKAEMIRRVRLIGSPLLNPVFGAESVVTSKTFEVCGSLHDGTSLTTSLNATEDDAAFFVRFTNLDNWNKARLEISDIKLIYPTPVISISTNPSNPLTLLQGQDEDRTFTVPDKQGTVKIELNWTNAARVKVQIFKPGANNAVATLTSATGQTRLTTADIPVSPSDGGEWRIVYTNVSPANVTAQSITTSIKMTVVE